jgi:hypothetical protein
VPRVVGGLSVRREALRLSQTHSRSLVTSEAFRCWHQLHPRCRCLAGNLPSSLSTTLPPDRAAFDAKDAADMGRVFDRASPLGPVQPLHFEAKAAQIAAVPGRVKALVPESARVASLGVGVGGLPA